MPLHIYRKKYGDVTRAIHSHEIEPVHAESPRTLHLTLPGNLMLPAASYVSGGGGGGKRRGPVWGWKQGCKQSTRFSYLPDIHFKKCWLM